MTTDRELLELAAKAIKQDTHDAMRADWLNGHSTYWNPLVDDGDALRLAVKLGISLTPYPIYNELKRHSIIAKQRRKSDTLREVNPAENMQTYGNDPYAAARCAIVCAAAEIGKRMETEK